MSKIEFNEKWSILKGIKSSHVDFAGSKDKIDTGSVAGVSTGGYKTGGKPGQAGGRARQEVRKKKQSLGIKSEKGGNLKGRQCIIKDGPNKGGVDPDCVSYNPTLEGRARLPVPSSTKDPVFKDDLFKLMHGDGGYEDPDLQGGPARPYDKKQALAVLYGMMNQRKKGTGGKWGLSSRQEKVQKHMPNLGLMGPEKRAKSLQAIHEAHDNDVTNNRAVRSAVHKYLIDNPKAEDRTPEKVLQYLKTHESGNMTKLLHPEDIRYIIADKKFQSDVRNAGYRIRELLKQNKNATPEDIIKELQGGEGENNSGLLDDELMELIKSGGYVKGLAKGGQAQPQTQTQEQLPDEATTNKWFNDTNADRKNKGLSSTLQSGLEEFVNKGAQMDEEGLYDPTSYTQEDYNSLLQKVTSQYPNLDQNMLKGYLKNQLGIDTPQAAPQEPMASSRPTAPNTPFEQTPLGKELGRLIRNNRGFGSARSIKQRNLADRNARVKQQAQAAASAQPSGAPGAEAPSPTPTPEAQGAGAPGAEAPTPEAQTPTPGAEAQTPPAAGGRRRRKAPGAEAPAPTSTPEAQGAGAPGAEAQTPPPAQSKPPASDEEHNNVGRTISDVLGSIKNNKAAAPLLKALKKFGLDVHAAHDWIEEALKRSASGGTSETTSNTPPQSQTTSEDSGQKNEVTPEGPSPKTTSKKKKGNKVQNSGEQGASDNSEYNFNAPYGWSFCEETTPKTNVVRGEDANRNLVKIPDGWGSR